MRNRTYRRFKEDVRIPEEKLEEWVENARYTASMRNVQPLKYIIVSQPEKCNKLTEMVTWAGYMPEWEGPKKGERPTAYIVQILDTDVAASGRYDEGLQLEAITLSACEDGFGSCIMLSFSQGDMTRYFDLPENQFPLAVVALGKPAEHVVIDDMLPYADVKYYRDDNDIHHVPKRTVDELILKRIYPEI
ncbi:MAG: nitroreductase family protein [Porphyromonadaceae bacterium]|nr:nitroreductase family protein [Porphyromonadaceae bacterium]